MEQRKSRQNASTAIREHFDAPMWADLTLEANSPYEYNITDDDWFTKNHLFHQLSARKLKSKFSHSVEDAVMLQGFASPGLPSSVSKSRGKHYNCKTKWGKGINLNALLDKQEGLSRRGCFKQGADIDYQVKPKSTISVGKPISGLTFEHNARGKTMSKVSCGNLVGSSSSMDKKNYERPTRTMLASENMIQKKDYKEHKKVSYDEKRKSSSNNSFGKSVVTEASRVWDQHKYMEVSNKPCDQKSGSSSVNSISLRKSYATQKVSKVEMDVDNMKSRGRKSSSGKSSVGSCSNPSYEVKFVSKEQRKKITNTKDVVTTNPADKNRCNLGNKFKTSSITAEGKGKGIILGNNINVAKSLIKSQSVRSCTKLPGKVNKANFCTAAKEMLHKGKENATMKLTVNKHCNEKGVLARGILKSPKSKEHNRQHRDGKAGSAALTILGKVNGQREAKNPVKQEKSVNPPARRIYLR
ncbi:uncharacterized protein LOC127075458 isoform X2 [Lathyrus oleraceus]|uniref:Uncharacterized protein n=1 Tax=Pisum sativum TaxID=3888 RepID=A0A9D5AQ94_PEA|nr:uncharacterized protein LOC127075458 isoform X2 [Pisum sativum]XP_050872881.1 uncharacterized protein LOC127075458 isoform X2 [Pisum sativum]XP_050872882.1 uncharacterized protein LOC127075458 isoform X2 [Pisum sativum]KAI5420487.1 hypothetical protein KIW84_044329 [Pisum sativum]